MLRFSLWKGASILLLSFLSVLFALPNFCAPERLSWLPDFVPRYHLSLGLDLQGGSHLLLEVDEGDVIQVRLARLKDAVRVALRKERITYSRLEVSDGAVLLRIRDLGRDKEVRALLDSLVVPSPSLGGLFGMGTAVREIRVETGGESGFFKLILTSEGIEDLVRSAVVRSMEVVRRRVDQMGTVSPTVQRQGRARLVVQVPGFHDPERLKILLGSTARLTFRFVDSTVSVEQAQEGRLPLGSELVAGAEGEVSPQLYVLEKREVLTGEQLVDARPGFSDQANSPIVFFRLDASSAVRFAVATQRNVGRVFAIVLDDRVISAPVIREPILGGAGQISGDFTVEEANNLAILLRAGALPAKLTILEERTVGAGLGADQIWSGVIACLVGAIAVLIFIFISYGLFGFFANIALLVNLSMIISALSIFGATLTLPGIAGIVLTIGMAVDANVLIFERIREEMAAGRSVIMSIDVGFSQALGAILDANITTFIATIILFYLGAGPVRGFAVTLAIGIVTSVFTAFVLSRFLIALWVRWRRPTVIPI